jgi:hypothetical protein
MLLLLLRWWRKDSAVMAPKGRRSGILMRVISEHGGCQTVQL